jgi:hypothetical protein
MQMLIAFQNFHRIQALNVSLVWLALCAANVTYPSEVFYATDSSTNKADFSWKSVANHYYRHLFRPDWSLFSFLLPALVFVGLYSILPHKVCSDDLRLLSFSFL